MSLLFNMLARLVIVYLPKGKYLLIHGCSDFGAQENSLSLFPLFLHLFVMKWWDWMPWSSFFECWVLSQLFHSPLSLSSRSSLVSSSLLSAIMAVSSAYLKLFIFLLSMLIPGCASSSLAFQMMYSVYKLNKQGDNKKRWQTPIPIWNQSVFLCLVLTVVSWPAYRF